MKRILAGTALGVCVIWACYVWNRNDVPVDQGVALKVEPAAEPAETGENLEGSRAKYLGNPRTYSDEVGFEYPFLGKVLASRGEETLQLPGAVSQKVKVYRTPKGEFIRAEYAKDGTYKWEWSPSNMESEYQMLQERITGIASEPQKLSLSQVVACLNEEVPLRNARQWSITAIELRTNNPLYPSRKKAESVYEARVFGVRTAGGKIPDEEGFRKVRYLLRFDGKVILYDNML